MCHVGISRFNFSCLLWSNKSADEDSICSNLYSLLDNDTMGHPSLVARKHAQIYTLMIISSVY